MSKSSDKKSAFGLSGDQIGRLLSLGYGKDSDVTRPSSSTDTHEDKDAPGQVAGSESSLQIDGYEIVGKIAEAGQGQIWRALQQSTGREVAIKVPKIGSVTSEQARIRFEREVELAARLKHPNIARIYDSGVDRGQYYYVMDFVKGLNLDDYVRQHSLTHRQILELMRTICQAVQHAHQNGIIHRDLKPSNVIVTDDGRPVIVDFGLAKGFLEDDRHLTVSIDGETVGTPAYMSPEQAAGHMDAVDTRSDVYSLGVTMFTLLTGSNPHDISGSRLEVIHRIADEEVKRPRCLNPKIDNDVEAMLLKALDKDPDRRYPTAAGLVQDIDNYLAGEPLTAGSQSNVYRLKKFVQRNWLLVTGLAAGLAVLMAGSIVSTLFALGQKRALAQAEAVAEFLTKDVLGSFEGINGRDATVFDITEAAAAKLDEGDFQDHPLVEASIRGTLSDLYYKLGYLKHSLQHKIREYNLLKQRDDSRITNLTMNYLALAHDRVGEYDEAESLFNTLMQNVATTHNLYPWLRYNLSIVYFHQGRYEEAERLRLKAMEAQNIRRFYVGGMGALYYSQGRYKEAEERLIHAMKLIEENRVHSLLDANHAALYVRSGLANVYVEMKRYKEAETLFEKVIEESRLVLPGEGHQATIGAMVGLAVLRTRQGDHDQADRLLKEALESQELKLGRDHPNTLETLNHLGVLRREQQRYGEAESLLREALEAETNKLGPDHPECFESMHELALLCKEQERYEEAQELLLKAIKGRIVKLGDTHPHTQESITNLIELYEAGGKPKEAERWRAKLPADGTTSGQSQNASGR